MNRSKCLADEGQPTIVLPTNRWLPALRSWNQVADIPAPVSRRPVAELMKHMTRTRSIPAGGLARQRQLLSAASLQLALVLLVWFGPGPTCQAGLKIYFLRHAEAGHNVVDQWKNKPRDQRPAYVGRPDAFTPKGKKQVADITNRLKTYHFDLIAVSPVWRARHTIAPYLREAGRKAELWPELVEFGSLEKQHDLVPLPSPSANLFKGDVIQLSDSDQDIFTLREDGHRLFQLGQAPAQQAADRWAVVQKDIDLIHKRLGGSDKSILLVSHGNIGSLLLEALTQDKELLKVTLANVSLWMVEEQPDGRFKLRLLNDQLVP
jgi:broad specificity phosphatase PhoE